MTSEIALTHVSTPLAPLVTVLHLIRTHPCSGNIFEVAQLLSWMVISSEDCLWSALGLRVMGLGVEDVTQGMRVLVWWHFLFGSSFKIHTYSNIKGRGVSSSLPDPFLSQVLVCLHLFLIFSLSLFSHFLFVSSSILIFCLSPSLSLFSVCLHLYLYFLSVSISIWRQTKNED